MCNNIDCWFQQYLVLQEKTFFFLCRVNQATWRLPTGLRQLSVNNRANSNVTVFISRKKSKKTSSEENQAPYWPLELKRQIFFFFITDYDFPPRLPELGVFSNARSLCCANPGRGAFLWSPGNIKATSSVGLANGPQPRWTPPKKHVKVIISSTLWQHELVHKCYISVRGATVTGKRFPGKEGVDKDDGLNLFQVFLSDRWRRRWNVATGWKGNTHTHTPDDRTSQRPTTSVQIQNHGTSYRGIDNIDIEQFAV